MQFYLDCPGERSWWRLARLPDGILAGLAIPSATPYARNVGYVGVVPEERGRGLIDDLLAEITRFHAAAGADRITATTDMNNRPMAAAFDRAGYRVDGRSGWCSKSREVPSSDVPKMETLTSQSVISLGEASRALDCVEPRREVGAVERGRLPRAPQRARPRQ